MIRVSMSGGEDAPLLDNHHLLVGSFKESLARENDDISIVRRHVLHGPCGALSDETHYGVKRSIAVHFDLDEATDIFVVGSAKLGFSIAPNKRWRPFSNRSDVDVAIINHELYERVWHEVHAYQKSGAGWPNQQRYNDYLAQGWIRPDLLPRSPIFAFSGEWWRFFQGLKQDRVAGPYKVAAGLYHDMNFLRRYQANAINSCRMEQG